MKSNKKISYKPSIVWISVENIDRRIDADYYHVNHIEDKNSDDSLLQLSEVCVLSKNRFNPQKYDNEFFKYIDISNIDIVTGDYEYQTISIKEAPSRARKKVNKNDIIVSTVRPNRNAVSLINIDDNELVVSTGFAVLKCNENIDSHYIFAVLKNNNTIEQLVRKTSGGLYPAISEQDILNIEIPIPILEIQKYIGDKIRKAQCLKKEAINKENEAVLEFKKIFNFNLRMEKIWHIKSYNLSDRLDCEYNFNHFFELEKNFYNEGLKVIKFGELILKKMSEPQTDSSDFTNEGVPVLRITDIHEDYIDFENCAKIPENIYSSLKEFQLIPKDIIFGLSGTVGRAIVVPQEIPEKAITNRRIAKVTLKDPEKAYYIAMFLNSEYGKMQLIRETTGGVQKNLRLEDINNINIPVPDEKTIKVISDCIKIKVDLLQRSRSLIEEAKQDIEDLIEGNFDMSKIKETN